jgi:Fe-S-cluster-containing dehydrogenase component/formate-dependent nitrite reductase membrane component NrfD
VRYGFVIDQNRCIGCHACTVACKEEHDVPVGVFRTWVKYVEKGKFPDTSRHFGVMRCNHCEQAPCVEICPTAALFRRPDGIVDFDSRRCIGCKSCMQACPYDALHINPDTNTAAKCNFCAHRVESNFEPACVIVCPTQAIIAGDLDDPQSKPSRIIATQKVSVRKPYKGTQPKLFYVGIDGALLQPTMTEQSPTHFWADKDTNAQSEALHAGDGAGHAPGTARVVYDVAHPAPWGMAVAAYLWTKSIAAGVLMLAAYLVAAGYEPGGAIVRFIAPVIALVFTAVTSVLLVADLKRPDRFYYILTRPNPGSWLVRGAYILMLYGALSTLWLLSGWFLRTVPPLLMWLAVTLAICAACYSAFLFAQAKGRDLWQSPIFFWRLLVQAVIAGAAVLAIAAVWAGTGPQTGVALAKILIASLGISFFMIVAEVTIAPASEDFRLATRIMTAGSMKRPFWLLAVALGTLAPVVLLAIGLGFNAPAFLVLPASLLALGGLWVFEELWVRAGQAVPLS